MSEIKLREGAVRTNGIRLHYLEWGRGERVLVFIHGLADNPYLFADLAPAFADDFRVIAYARRGHGQSDACAPYDNVTLVDDLVGLMDALGVAKADFAGYSMGGNEGTGIALRYPNRVRHLVYLDAAYDYANPEYKAALKALPPVLRQIPEAAFESFDAFTAFYLTEYFVGIQDGRRVVEYLRDTVDIAADGTVYFKTPVLLLETAIGAEPPRDYTCLSCPILAIYAQEAISSHGADSARRDAGVTWECQYLRPFCEKSVATLRRQAPHAKITFVPGAHNDFLFTSRHAVVATMRDFLLGK